MINRIAFAIASALVALSLSAAFYLARAADCGDGYALMQQVAADKPVTLVRYYKESLTCEEAAKVIMSQANIGAFCLPK